MRDQLNVSYRYKFIKAKKAAKPLGHFTFSRFHNVHWQKYKIKEVTLTEEETM